MKLFQSLFLIVVLLFSNSVFAEKISINNATAEQLAAEMTGIGESKAQAIVEYRKTHGNFESVDALQNVDGIGEKTVEKNREKLTL